MAPTAAMVSTTATLTSENSPRTTAPPHDRRQCKQERSQSADPVGYIASKWTDKTTHQSTQGGNRAGGDAAHAVLLVEEEWKNAAESDEPAERHGVQPAEPISLRMPDHHRHVMPPVPLALGSPALPIVTHDEHKDHQGTDKRQNPPPEQVVPSTRGRNARRTKENQHGANITRRDNSQHPALMSGWIRPARQRQGPSKLAPPIPSKAATSSNSA
jgi:hypothetical protein